MYNKKIKTFYNKKQVCFDGIRDRSFSKSPLKPYLLLRKIRKDGYSEMIEIETEFEPFKKEDFYAAHTKTYVNNVFNKKGNYKSNGLPWSENLVESLTYTNSSLFNAIENSYLNSNEVSFSPTSGMHHATPKQGSGFCTFSGQVISAIKMYEKYGAIGCWLDLDGHVGNSIEDTRIFNPTINKAVPSLFNVNIIGKKNKHYTKELLKRLEILEYYILNDRLHYIVFAHGADSHQWDDIGNACDTMHWFECSQIFYTWVNEINKKLDKPLPIILQLFGGYRKDDYNSVLSLHMNDLIYCSNILCGNNFEHKIEVKKPAKLDFYERYFGKY